MWVSLTEPCGECARIATTNDDHRSRWDIPVYPKQEVGDVSQSLLGAEVLKTLHAKSIERLRLAIVSVLQCQEQGTLLRSHHEWIESVLPDGASVLAANVEENRRRLVGGVEVLVIDPVPSFERSVILIVEVINWCIVPQLLEIRHIDLW